MNIFPSTERQRSFVTSQIVEKCPECANLLFPVSLWTFKEMCLTVLLLLILI